MRATLNIFIFLTLCFSYAQAERGKVARRLVGPFANTNTRVTKPSLKRFGEAKNYHLPTPNLSVNFKNKGKDATESSTQNNASPNTDLNLSGGVSGADGISGINPAGLRPGDLNPNSKLSSNSGNSPKGSDSDEGRNTGGQKGNGGGQDGGTVSQSQSFKLWWPVCVFVDGPDANQQVTEMVQMSAACGVNLQPYVRVVTGFNPEDHDGINNLQRSSCNLKDSGVAEKGSTLVITNRSSTVADKMCGITQDRKDPKKPSTDVAGCNELANGASGDTQKRAEANKNSGDGFGGVAQGSVAVGIVDREGYTQGSVYSHEAIGHGQMGWPNGKKAGNGIGNPNDKDDNGGEGDLGSYTGIGCTQMRAAAIPDPEGHHRYDPNRKTYYSHNSMAKNPMQLGEPIWKKFKDGPQNDGLIAKNTPAGTRGAEDSPASGRSSGGASSSGAHPKGIASGKEVRGSSVRTGDAVTVNSGSASSKRGERGSDDSTGPGELPPLNGPGKAADENTIVGKRSEGVWGSNNGDPSQGGSSSGGDNSFFAAGDGAEGRISESSSGGDSSGQGSDSMNVSFAKGDSSDRLDPDFFKKTQAGKNIAERSSRIGARNSGDITQSSESVVQRSLASKPEIAKPDKNPSAGPSKNSYVVNPPNNPSTRGTGRGKSQLGYENNI